MTIQISASNTQPTISEIFQKIKSGTLVLQPDFQRRYVWTKKHKFDFIDTIRQGYPFPEIYSAILSTNLETLETQECIVDGQQRLTTIVDFIEGKNDFKSENYSILSDTEKKLFLEYRMIERQLGQLKLDEVKEIFKRINKTKFGLNSVEIQNAIYSGEFISTAEQIGEILQNEEKFPVLTNSGITRMQDMELGLVILSTLEFKDYFTRNEKVDDYIEKFDNEYPNKETILNTITKVLDFITKIALPNDSIWFNKSNFLTMVVEFSKNSIEFQEQKNESIFREKLINFENKILNAKGNTDTDEGEYYAAMFTGTNSKQSRIKRGKYFHKYVILN